jgi:preprotein translocase subunit YajC
MQWVTRRGLRWEARSWHFCPSFCSVVFIFADTAQQKRAKTHKSFIENLKKGDRVVTSGGLYGTITGVTDDAVTIEIAEKVRVKILKSAVADYAKGE